MHPMLSKTTYSVHNYGLGDSNSFPQRWRNEPEINGAFNYLGALGYICRRNAYIHNFRESDLI